MDIDTTPPTAHREPRAGMQLDLPASHDVMMEVDPDLSRDPNHSAPSVSPSHSALHHGSAHASPSSRQLDGPSPSHRPLPAPPVVLIASSDLPAWAKRKLDQLFVEWLARPESKAWLRRLLDDARAGKASSVLASDYANRAPKIDRSPSAAPTRSPTSSSQPALNLSAQQAPGSPVSRLFRSHLPFGDADTSPRSPGPLQPNAVSSFRPALTSPFSPEFHLGRSGTASPVHPDHRTPEPPAPPSRNAHLHASPPSSNDITPSKQRGSAGFAPDLAQEHASKPIAGHLPDCNALDKVADGIAGMSPVVDTTPSSDNVEVTASASEAKPSSDASVCQEPDSVRAVVQASSAVRHVRNDVHPDSCAQRAAPVPIQSQSPAKAFSPLRGAGAELGETSKTPAVKSSAVFPSASTPASAPSDVTSDVGVVGDAVGVKPQEPDQQADRSDVTGDIASAMRVERQSKMASSTIPPPTPKTPPPQDATMTEASGPPKRKSLPRFYFPCGRDAEQRERKELETMKQFFRVQKTQKNMPGVGANDIAELVVEVIGLPSYFASIVFNAIVEGFALPSVAGERGGRSCKTNVQGRRGSGEGHEISMRDVSGAEQAGESAGRAGDSVARSDSGATHSDTTMGDVSEGGGTDRRLNGFHATSQGNEATSGGVVRDPTAIGESPVHNGGTPRDFISEEQFSSFYEDKCAGFSKEARLFAVLREPGVEREYLIPSDFKPLLRALLMCHQGLAFLHATPEFQQRYSETVIERIYFGCTRQHNGRLTLHDIRRSKLLDTLMVVDEEEDINRERKFFSYEHFYVLYCRFWELDANHDLQIDREDLMRYGSHSLTYRIVDRIFGGYARPLDTPENPGFMSYTDFIWFCLSEEDKTSDTAIDYWFRCIDMDGDGLITMYDMEFFYKEQLHRMQCFGHEPVQIRDILCQLLDMISPNVNPPVIRRKDLKRCRLAGNFFNVLFNLNKFFAIEARDPLQIRQEHATPELTDWDRFAALEYLRLSAEEEGEEDESWEDVGEAANPLMAGEAPF